MNEFPFANYPIFHTVPPVFRYLMMAWNVTSVSKDSDRGVYSILQCHI